MGVHSLHITPPTQANSLNRQMNAFEHWRLDLGSAITSCQQWLNSHGWGSPEIELRLHEMQERLRSDKFTIAFVAEFSRGKTELINAIFFADYQRRLLPSDVGQTTMCPTEILYDHVTRESYIRLLPIETRLADRTIREFKDDPDQWTTIALDTASPDKMAETFREVIKTKQVSREIAEQLGLLGERDDCFADSGGPDSDTVTIPMWRHALISFPHPLLKQGLVVLDTPGLNALGTEPELTFTMLPSAQAVMFILAADTGVTGSDMNMWRTYITRSCSATSSNLIAALNKIDTLWDDMKSPQEIEHSINEQCRKTARQLGIDVSRVFPVSAQKGLVAQIRGDRRLLTASRLDSLQSFLANEVLPAKQRLIWENVVTEVSALLDDTGTLIATRLAKLRKNHSDICGLRERNTELANTMIATIRKKQEDYYQNVAYFETCRRKLAQNSKMILGTLNVDAIDRMAQETRDTMVDSWTTSGLKKCMADFFDGVRDTMKVAETQCDQAEDTVGKIYQRLQEEHSLVQMNLRPFDIGKFRREVEDLHSRAKDFRDSRTTTMTEQTTLIKKFFVSLVSHVRQVYAMAHREAKIWFEELTAPLIRQVEDNRELLEKHMESLLRVNESRNELAEMIQDIERRISVFDDHLVQLRDLRQSMHRTKPDHS
ncbi:MAG: hypothetical protein FD165_2097 [Gammaproteobacteria bacterium]|nr:MAG: hypothetical protein FD165_2097 [Gammaproteobacteria bacterium]TND03454.1 MAG: hypothetical protein FD120_1849 [Gammaproteobacteria bacterium]